MRSTIEYLATNSMVRLKECVVIFKSLRIHPHPLYRNPGWTLIDSQAGKV